MSDSRQSIIYKRMCKLQKCRIYPKSQVKNLVAWCRKLKNQAIFPKQNLHSLYIERRRHIVTYIFESSHPLLFSESEPEAMTPSHTARCLPLTGSDGNATMLNPTVRENLLFPSSSPSARYRRRFPQAQSMVTYGASYLRIYKKRVL